MSASRQLQPPIRADRLSDQVAAQLQALVTDNAIKPGEKLPSERELATQLGVSRSTPNRDDPRRCRDREQHKCRAAYERRE